MIHPTKNAVLRVKDRAPGEMYEAASNAWLDRWFYQRGNLPPPPSKCSPVRWRIYLRYRKARDYFDSFGDVAN